MCIFRLSLGMLPAVQFDDQPRFQTDEIGHVTGDRKLASKLCVGEPAGAQALPQCTFRIGCCRTQLPRDFRTCS